MHNAQSLCYSERPTLLEVVAVATSRLHLKSHPQVDNRPQLEIVFIVL